MNTQGDKNQVRKLTITTSKDKMKAFITIKYSDEVLEKCIITAFYTASDIRSKLAKAGVTYGIIDIPLEKYGLANCTNQLIASGKRSIAAVDDSIVMNFKTEKNVQNLVEETNGNIDFKSIGSIEPVHAGDVIALYIKGAIGVDGIDIFGNIIRYEKGKVIKLQVSDGCEIKQGNKVVALIDGKLCIKAGTFSISKLHQILGDVDIKTGNIKFIGDIVIFGGVKENMSVYCGSSLKIYKNVEGAQVKSQRNIEISGNVITSHITGGGEDVTRQKGIIDLENVKTIIKAIILNIEEVRKYNLLGEGKRDGEIIKVLIENKYKNFTRLCIRTIAFLNMQKKAVLEEALVVIIRTKLIFFGPLNIMHYTELDRVIILIDEKLKYLKEFPSNPVEVKFSYCQDSIIESTGNIILTGKGEYVSEITSSDGVYFTNPSSVTRGGSIIARNIIKCASVGSAASVATVLKVESSGHIWIDKAYQNTKIIIGNKEYIFNEPCKSIHAFLESGEELIVERLKLMEV